MNKVERRFKDKEGNNHLVDKGGNHFINNKCVNPKSEGGGAIGDTYLTIKS